MSPLLARSLIQRRLDGAFSVQAEAETMMLACMLVPVARKAKVGRSLEVRCSHPNNTGRSMFWFPFWSCHKTTLNKSNLAGGYIYYFGIQAGISPSLKEIMTCTPGRTPWRNSPCWSSLWLISCMLSELPLLFRTSYQGTTLFTGIWVLQHQQSRQSLTDTPTEQPDKDNYWINTFF